MVRKAIQDGAGRGIRKAAAYHPERVAEALKEFRHLNTREARAAFADHWIGLWAREFDDAWPMLYELLEIVKDDELYRDPRRVGPGAAGGPETHGDASKYPDFRAYFEDRVSRSFETWAELESTYQFVHEYRPDFFGKSFEAAKREIKALGAHGTNRHTSRGDDITSRSRGTDPDYLTARLKRDAEKGVVDLALVEKVVNGEISPNAAARQAGIRHHYLQVRADDAASAARTLRKYMSPDQLAELARLLTDESR